MANIGTIVGGGFGLIRRRPSAVLCWGLIYVLGTAALGYAQMRLVGTTGPVIAGQADLARLSVRGIGLALVFELLSLGLSSVLSAAVFRAVLWPEDRGVASIRFGMDEVRLIGLSLIVYLLSLVGGLVGGLGLVFLTSLIGLVFGGSPMAAGIFATLVMLGALGVLIVLLVRLSVVYPLVLVRRRISLDAGWELTRGHFWSLFGAYVLLALAAGALLLLAFLPLFALGVSPHFRGGANFWPGFFQQLGSSDPQMMGVLVVVGLVVGSVLCGVSLALFAGSAASAAKDLLARGNPDLAGTETTDPDSGAGDAYAAPAQD